MNGSIIIKHADTQPDTYYVEWHGDDNSYYQGVFLEGVLEIAVRRLVACLTRKIDDPKDFGFTPF